MELKFLVGCRESLVGVFGVSVCIAFFIDDTIVISDIGIFPPFGYGSLSK